MRRHGGTTALAPRLLYSQCWEDIAVARAALRITPGATVLAIGAAGDNVLGLLQDDPARIVAVDVNPAQTALVHLKMAAIRSLPDAAAVAAFLGASDGSAGDGSAGDGVDRAVTYRRTVRQALPHDAARYWDGHVADLARGVIHAGRFERYLARFRALVLPIVPGRRTVRAMLAATNLKEQRRIFRQDWDTWRWRLLVRVFFSRALLRRFGRDPALFENAEVDDVGSHYLARAAHAFMDIPMWENPYVTYILSGRYGTGARLPDYLRPEVQAIVRARLDHLEVRTASLDDVLESLPAGSIDAFYLSDVFELSTAASHAATLAEIARVGRPGARLCYWNNLVPRRRPAALAGRLSDEGPEARRLYAADRAFLYSGLVIETVRGGLA